MQIEAGVLSETNDAVFESKGEFDYIVKPYQESISDFFKLNYIFFWLAITSIITMIDCHTLGYYNENPQLLLPHISIGIIVFVRLARYDFE